MNEQLYKDFSEKVLPQVAQGLQITQEYFTDLFGRYIHYLTVSDAVWMVVCVLAVIGCVIAAKKMWDAGDGYGSEIFALFPGIFAVIALIGAFMYFDNLIKDVYVPEIRIYEQLMTKE